MTALLAPADAFADTVGRTRAMPAPLVTIVVRSMGRPELAGALACLAAQDHPALDVVVVDATNGAHPPLPTVDWRDGHRVRLLAGTRRLNRTEAANAGLDAVRGEFFGYLDDDDDCEPTHVSTLVRAAREHPDALAVYGRAQWLRPDGTLERLHGLPFNRMLQFHAPLMCWQAALFRRRVIDLGCRFRVAFDRLEDRDFVAQVADRGELVLIDAATFRFRPDLGTSGTGSGANFDLGRLTLGELAIRNAWYGSGTFHTARAVHYAQRAARRFVAGHADEARRILEDACLAYPEDPNALDGLAWIALAAGDLDAAEAYVRRALAVRDAPALRATLAAIQAARHPPASADPAAASRSQGRLAPCRCGSGRRYKECCGRLDGAPARAAPSPPASPATPVPDDRPVARARAALDRGDAALALDLAAGALGSVDDGEARRLFGLASATAGRAAREASMRDFLRQLLARRHLRAEAASVHVVGDFRAGHPDRETSRILAHEPRWAAARWWSIAGPAAPIDGVPALSALDGAPFRDAVARGALLLLAGAMPPDDWLDACDPATVTVHHDGDLERLLAGLAQVDCAKPSVALDAWPAP